MKRATEAELRKEEYFLEAGKIAKQVAFILEDVFRACYYNDKGEETTRYIMDENNLMFDYVNFEANTVSSEYMQAAIDNKFLVF